ncbi:MAG: glucose-6-phosphate isomerase [Peptococcaceae bacterium]|nr:glucose-6-phosphate isomerase [Peptococcaceae bacterium]
MSVPAGTQQDFLSVDVNYMMADFLGGTQGISALDLQRAQALIDKAGQRMQQKRSEMVWRELPYSQTAVVEQILAYAAQAKGQFENFVVLGIGGSGLGPTAVHQALNHPYYNELSAAQRAGFPRFYVVDNIDPERFAGLLDVINPATTLFNVITKSGSTSETMAQFLIIREMLRQRLGTDYAAHIVATTDQTKGNLIAIACEEGYKTFFVPDGVGGRFSELCPVGLLPAAMTGVDIKQLLAGAAAMDEWLSNCRTWDSNPAYLRAVLQYLAIGKGKNISVMMPYSEALKYFADWYAQLWAESLGKRVDLAGNEVFAGQTPVKALGVTDQHSQVQLFTEGPFDKVVNFLAVGEFKQEVAIPSAFGTIPGVAFLGGHTLNELMQAERRATEFALLKAGRLNNTIMLPEVNAYTLGQLIYLLEVETAMAGELLGIDAFDQPGVEAGKNATYGLMGRPGYEQNKQAVDQEAPKLTKYILQR